MRFFGALFALAVFVSAPALNAAPPKAVDKEDAEFERRFAALSKAKTGVVAVSLADNDTMVPDGPTLVAGQRTGIYTPPLLSPEDIQSVLKSNMKDVRECYIKQLAADPEWADRLILDLAVKKTGRISEVAVAPRRVRRAELGQCLLRVVPQWKFPEFTGELEDGITQEVVTASFPLSFSAK